MQFELALADGFRLIDSQKAAPILLRGNAHIVACLALANKPVSREKLCQMVWPDIAPQTARNRLRVALSALRAQLPSVIVESADGLCLNEQIMLVDVRDIRNDLEKAEDIVTAIDELDAIKQATSSFGKNTPFDVICRVGPEYCRTVSNATMRGALIADKLGKPDDVIRLARLSVQFAPEDVSLWTEFLLAAWRVGREEEALAFLKSDAKTPVLEAQEIKETARKIRSPYSSRDFSTSPEERDLVIELFEHLEADRRDLWRSFLSSPQSLALAGKYPKQMLRLLERAVAPPVEIKDEHWERCTARLIGLKAWLNDSDAVLALAPALIEASTDPNVLRATWNTVAIAHSLKRDWKAADQALTKSAEYARQTGNDINIQSAKGVGAYFMMQQGDYDRAFQTYNEVLDSLWRPQTPHSLFEHAVCIGHQAFVPLFSKDWDKAATCLERAIKQRTEAGVQMGQLQAALATTYRFLDRTDNVVQLARASLIDAFASESVTGVQWTFEVLAGALVRSNQAAYGFALLEWVLTWRQRTGQQRSKAEQDLCDEFVRTVPPSQRHQSIDVDARPEDVGKDVMRRLRAGLARSQNDELSGAFGAPKQPIRDQVSKE